MTDGAHSGMSSTNDGAAPEVVCLIADCVYECVDYRWKYVYQACILQVYNSSEEGQHMAKCDCAYYTVYTVTGGQAHDDFHCISSFIQWLLTIMSDHI